MFVNEHTHTHTIIILLSYLSLTFVVTALMSIKSFSSLFLSRHNNSTHVRTHSSCTGPLRMLFLFPIGSNFRSTRETFFPTYRAKKRGPKLHKCNAWKIFLILNVHLTFIHFIDLLITMTLFTKILLLLCEIYASLHIFFSCIVINVQMN